MLERKCFGLINLREMMPRCRLSQAVGISDRSMDALHEASRRTVQMWPLTTALYNVINQVKSDECPWKIKRACANICMLGNKIRHWKINGVTFVTQVKVTKTWPMTLIVTVSRQNYNRVREKDNTQATKMCLKTQVISIVVWYNVGGWLKQQF